MKAPLSALNLTNCLYDMENGVDRIVAALQKREKILVFGDYDVGGRRSTLTLTDFLRKCGGRVPHYIPHRMEEGYGLYLSLIHIFRCRRSL